MGKVVSIALLVWTFAISSFFANAEPSIDLTLGGVRPGMSKEKVHSTLGKGREIADKNLSIFRRPDGNEIHVLYDPSGVVETVVVTWVTPHSDLAVKNRLGETRVSFGMRKEDLQQKLGQPTTVKTNGSLTHWTFSKLNLSVVLSKDSVVGASLTSD